MNKEIKKRKRSFWAVFVVTLLMAIQIVPIAVSAANHSFGDVTDNPATEPTKVSIMHPGDVLTAIYVMNSTVSYYDKDGTTLLKEVDLPAAGDTHTVMDYSAMPSPRQISDDGFKEWKVTNVAITGSVVNGISLTAVEKTVARTSTTPLEKRKPIEDCDNIISLLRRTSNNINQIAIKVNATGVIYPNEIAEIQQKQTELWCMLDKIIAKFSKVK